VSGIMRSRRRARCWRTPRPTAVSLSVGFYYMANACGRLLGTLLAGVLYQWAGVTASLWGAVVLAAAAGAVRCSCRPVRAEVAWAGARSDD
jgi:predicted MFS family arabinose efflux permease